MTKVKKTLPLMKQVVRVLTTLNGVVGGADNSSKRCEFILTAAEG